MEKLVIYNTRTRKKEEFKPIKAKEVGLYTCGPTVYNYMHIGNLRSFTFADILRRVLVLVGYKVKHVMNITDVGHLTGDEDMGEEKMMVAAKREKKTVWEIAEFYTDAFKKDIKALHLLQPDKMPKATDHIKDMIKMIKQLEENGVTYEAGGNIYFDTSKFENYTSLAQLADSDESKARVEQDPNKKNPRDFVLWFTKSKFQDQEMKWESPWGEGYPGWHIECSAMSSKYLGEQFDIHTGGIDHLPVHHTNEVAQSEASCSCSPWVNYWLHGEFLIIDEKRMAKSEGNFITLETLREKGYEPEAYRLFLFSAHYRQKLNFSWEGLDAAQSAWNNLKDIVRQMAKPAKKGDRKYEEKFKQAVLDDLNMPKAIAVMWELLKDGNVSSEVKHASLLYFDQVLGLEINQIKPLSIPKNVQKLVEQREKARHVKDWDAADELRGKIENEGYLVEDTPGGYLIKEK